MESQQLSNYPHISHGSACASVTSKEVQTTQDPLDISASKTEECEKVSLWRTNRNIVQSFRYVKIKY